jgi:hypothetical protein
MALLGKERAVNPTPNTTTIRTSATVADLTTNISKIPAPEVIKPEPFHELR